MYNIDVPYLTHLRMKSYIAHIRSTVYYVNVQYLSMYLTYSLANEILHYAHVYLPYLPTFPYLTVYSAIVKKKKKKE